MLSGDRQSVLSDVPEDDAVQAQAKELIQKAKALDAARRGYMEDSQRILGRQQEAIDHLKGENRRIKEELAAETKAGTAAPTAAEHSRIIQLKDLVESFSRKLELEQRRAEEQSTELEVTEVKALNLRKLVGGSNGARDNTAQLERMCSVLDNRLEKAQVKYNQMLSKNKKQREEIEHLRKERVTFENIYKKLEVELHEKKGELSSKIEASNIAYEARDQALAEMATVRAKADGEQAEFESEMARLGARLGDGRRNRDAAMRELLYSSVKSMSQLKGQGTAAMLSSYEDAFECLKGSPGGAAEPGVVVDNFLAKEDANLVLFNYIRELKEESERLGQELREKEAERESVKKKGRMTTDSTAQRKEMVKELEEELHRVVDKRDALQEKNSDTARTLSDLEEAAKMIAERVGAQGEQMERPDGAAASDVRGHSLHHWLGVLEQRANEAATMWVAYQRAEDRTPGSGPVMRETAAPAFARPSAGMMLKIDAPSIGAASGSDTDSSSDGEDEVPLTREQLKTKVIRETGIAYEDFISDSDLSLKAQAGRQRPVSAMAKIRGAPPAAGAPPSSLGRRITSARPGARKPPGGPASARRGSGGDDERKTYAPRAAASSNAADGAQVKRRVSSATSKSPAGSHWR